MSFLKFAYKLNKDIFIFKMVTNVIIENLGT